MFGQQPILVLSQNTKRDSGRKVQLENINAGKTIADVIRTCLGPQAMLKMLMDPMGGIVMTNDGNAILREITVQHPAAKSMIEIARTQDEEVGDGTTSVIVLAGEMLAVAEQFLVQNIHPTVIIREYRQALEDAVKLLQDNISIPIDLNDRDKLKDVIRSCVGTKYIGRWADLAVDIALDAVNTVTINENGRVEVDIKNYAKVEKIPGGTIEESKDFTRLLQLEEEHVQRQCEEIIALKPDIVFTEKGISDLAQHYLVKAGITAIRRLRKTDNNRLARACGATIVNRTEELKESDVGTGAGKFEVKKIGDEYFTFVTECKNPKACTILLRGASKDVLNEIERNLQDALHVAKNLVLNPRLVAGGGAVEMAVSQALAANAAHNTPYRAVAQALEIIPRTLAQNCGANTIRTLTALRARHAAACATAGIDGETGDIVDMAVYKTAVETAILLLRIDDIVSGSKKKDGNEPATPGQMAAME
ncbi:hypothetical protein HF086_001970 [Spodoptera exigua]|uniref:T-complex protein 1 subunit gamma n=1 Tax=Spodoptera exigua TaxID=7107 RepID=A0A922MQQ1_SPOEX|nr:hypothetical protein HF086_001970 [Spodoptera exigua]